MVSSAKQLGVLPPVLAKTNAAVGLPISSIRRDEARSTVTWISLSSRPKKRAARSSPCPTVLQPEIA